VPLPASRNAINRLGKKLAADDQFTAAESDLFEELLSAYSEAMEEVQGRLSSLGLKATGRVKETRTLAEKLRRQPGMQLLSLDDIAGVRLVLPGGRVGQDQVVEKIVGAFSSQLVKAPIDRRKNPSHGYRAVHVIVSARDGLRVEIQVRTDLQDLWAQIIEILGSKWGRELRYGEPIRNGTEPVFPQANQTRQGFYTFCQKLADIIAENEESDVDLHEVVTMLRAAAHDPWTWTPRNAVRLAGLWVSFWLADLSGRRLTARLRSSLMSLVGVASQMEG
jgi:ppGpp synthetase/RelA/SpoT-type nucleotidyltranferase